MLRKMGRMFKEIGEIVLHITLVVAALGMFVGIFVVIPATPGMVMWFLFRPETLIEKVWWLFALIITYLDVLWIEAEIYDSYEKYHGRYKRMYQG